MKSKIDILINEHLKETEEAWPGLLEEQYGSAEHALEAGVLLYEQILSTSKDDFNTIDDAHIHKLIKRKNKKIREYYKDIPIKDLSNIQLAACKEEFKHMGILLSILYFPSKTEVQRYSQQYLWPLQKEFYDRQRESKKKHPNRYYSGKLISKGDEESRFYMRKDINENTRGLVLPGDDIEKDDNVKWVKYHIKEQAKIAEPIKKIEPGSKVKTGYDTTQEFETLYYESSSRFWNPIINDYKQSVLAILGGDMNINNIIHDVRKNFMHVREGEYRELYSKTRSQFREYKKVLSLEKKFRKAGGLEPPEELKYFLEHNVNYKTPIDENKVCSNVSTDDGIRELDEPRERACLIKELTKWDEVQPKQAHGARKVVEYIQTKLESMEYPNPRICDEDEDKMFTVTTVAESTGVDPGQVRKIYNKMKTDIPLFGKLR